MLTAWSGAHAQAQDVQAIEPIQENLPTFSDLFRANAINRPAISPDGKKVAYVRGNILKAGNAEIGIHTIGRLARNVELTDLVWSGNDQVLVQETHKISGVQSVHALNLGMVGEEYLIVRTGSHEVDGYVHDPLVGDDEHIVFAKRRETENDRVVVDLFRLAMFKKIKGQTKDAKRLVADNDRLLT